MPEKKRYKNPPIVERVIGVYHKTSPEEFEKRLPSWIDRIRDEYPIPENLAEWTLDIEEKNGIPIVKNLMPTARIIRVFWKKHKANQQVFGMRLRPDRLVFHLRREEGNSHDFDELIPEMEKWLPLWAEHFGINDIQSITVEYVNLLNGIITPQLQIPGQGIAIDEAITVFGHFPGEHFGITDPYECKVRLVMDPIKPIYFDFKVQGEKDGQIRIDFVVRTRPAIPLSFSQAIAELHAGHEIILDQFSCFFTEKARNSFDK